jgi:hypothetical protein
MPLTARPPKLGHLQEGLDQASALLGVHWTADLHLFLMLFPCGGPGRIAQSFPRIAAQALDE